MSAADEAIRRAKDPGPWRKSDYTKQLEAKVVRLTAERDGSALLKDLAEVALHKAEAKLERYEALISQCPMVVSALRTALRMLHNEEGDVGSFSMLLSLEGILRFALTQGFEETVAALASTTGEPTTEQGEDPDA